MCAAAAERPGAAGRRPAARIASSVKHRPATALPAAPCLPPPDGGGRTCWPHCALAAHFVRNSHASAGPGLDAAEQERPLVVSIQPNAIVDHLCVIRDEAELKALVPDEIGRFGPCHHLLPVQRCRVPLV